MDRLVKQPLLCAALACIIALCASCGARTSSHPATLTPVNALGAAVTTPDSRTGLPSPLSIKRGATTLQNVLQATDFLPPYVQNAVPSGTDLVLTADPGEPGPAGLAYAVYELTPEIHGNVESVLHLTWHAAPGTDTAWLGVANFNTGQWEWQVLDPTAGDTLLDAPGKNDDATGHIMAAIVIASGSATLARVRYGHNEAPVVRLAIDKPNTPVPFDVLLEGRDLADPEGSVTDIAFDPDGTGYVDNGTTNTYTFNATQTGTFTARIKVTDDEGAVTELSREWSSGTYYIWDGGSVADNSFFMDIATLPGGGFYSAGWRQSIDQPMTPELLVVKYDNVGGIEWSKSTAINFQNEFKAECVAGPNDSVYVACRGDATQAPYNVIALMRFDADGTVVWQERWGDGRCDLPPSLLADNAAGTLYLSCDVNNYGNGFPRNPALTCFDGNDGSQVWSKTLPPTAQFSLYQTSDGLAQDSDGNVYLSSVGVALLASPATPLMGVAKFDTAGNLLAASGFDTATDGLAETLFGGGGGGPLIVTLWAPGPTPATKLLLLNDDLSVRKAETLNNVGETIVAGEINLTPDNSVWISNENTGTTLLHISDTGSVLNVLTDPNAYLPALGLAADGSLLSTGSSYDGLPQWTSPATVGVTDQAVNISTLDLTASDWTYPLETTTHTVSDVQPTTPAATGGLIYRFTP